MIFPYILPVNMDYLPFIHRQPLVWFFTIFPKHGFFTIDPLENGYITMENHHFSWKNSLFMAIFHTYVRLQQGIYINIHSYSMKSQSKFHEQIHILDGEFIYIDYYHIISIKIPFQSLCGEAMHHFPRNPSQLRRRASGWRAPCPRCARAHGMERRRRRGGVTVRGGPRGGPGEVAHLP